MIHEEYLNPEFMFRMMNYLCKKDNYILEFFTFGKLIYKGRKQPPVLQNDYGYNMVYKMQIYKAPDPEVSEKLREKKMSFEEFCEQADEKVIYFDISNGCFVEHDKTVENFQEFPPYFSVNNQIYYAIYTQPKLLKQHYSEGREIDNLYCYCKFMEINHRHIFTLTDFRHEAPQARSFDYTCAYKRSSSEQQYSIEQSSFSNALAKDDVIDFHHWGKHNYNISTYKFSKDFYRLHIHQSNFPVFYTANVLELTLPLAEGLKRLSSQLSCTIGQVNEALSLMNCQIRSCMTNILHSFQQTYFLWFAHMAHHALEVKNRNEYYKREAWKHAEKTTGYTNDVLKKIAEVTQIERPENLHFEQYERLKQEVEALDPANLSIKNLLSISEQANNLLMEKGAL